jgi:hypothetical protein
MLLLMLLHVEDVNVNAYVPVPVPVNANDDNDDEPFHNDDNEHHENELPRCHDPVENVALKQQWDAITTVRIREENTLHLESIALVFELEFDKEWL